MKYVKLIAKPDTWFKAGTEVFHYDFDYDEKHRISLLEWKIWEQSLGVLVRGIRISETNCEMNREIGTEYIDGEWCSCDEFEVEIIEE